MRGLLKNSSWLPTLASIQAECLFLGFGFFLLVQLVVSPSVVTTISFYAILLPLLLWYAWEEKPLVKQWHHLMLPAVCLFAYTTLHALFLTEGHHGLGKTIGNTLATYGFAVAATLVFSQPKPIIQRLFHWLCVVAALGATLSILLFFADMPQEGRLIPLGRAHHSVLGASVYSVMALISLHLFRESKNRFYLVAFGIIALMVLLTGSRAPITLLAISALAVFLYPQPRNKKLILSLVAGLTILLCLLLMAPFFSDTLLRFVKTFSATGSGYRLDIWATTLAAIVEKPWFGHGLQARLDFAAPHIYSPHNLYLATAYYLGIPGLLLLLVMVGHAFYLLRDQHKTPYDALCLILLIHGLLSGMTDHGQVVKGPSPLWIIFWLPFAMIWGNHLRTKLKTV